MGTNDGGGRQKLAVTISGEMRKVALSVESVVRQLSPLYRIRLVAGREGVDRTGIYWVSLVEDYGTEKFKHINEIVITAGLKNSTTEQLLTFAQNLHRAEGRALMINVGKYIETIPQELIAYCNEVALPLYAIPWDVLMSDVVKDISHILMYDEVKNASVPEIMQNVIFQTKSVESQINKLSLYGYSGDSQFCPALLKIDGCSRDEFDLTFKSIRLGCEKAAENLMSRCIVFPYNEMAVLVFVDMNREGIQRFIQQFLANLTMKYVKGKVCVCIGHVGDGIYRLSVNFKRILPLMNVAERAPSGVLFYDDAGVFQILAEVSDMKLLRSMYSRTFGILSRYDGENGTELSNYMESYLRLDGNVQAVAGQFFVHRNTVNNQLKKIRDLTGINPMSLEGKLQFMLGMKIGELYSF